MRPFDCLSSDCPLLGPHILEASAGTGKTFAIEHITVRLLLEEIELNEILVVTFTKAATRELKSRIKSNIEKSIFYLKNTSSPWAYLTHIQDTKKAIRILSNASSVFDQSHIFTIHGFCHRMLKEFAFEADLGLHFSKSDEKGSIPKKLMRAATRFLEKEIVSDLLSIEQVKILLKSYDSLEEIGKALFSPIEGANISFKDSCNAYQQALLKWNDSPFIEEKLLEDFHKLAPHYKATVKGNFKEQIRALALSFNQPNESFLTLLKEKGSLFAFLDPSNRKIKYREPEFLYYPSLFIWGLSNISPLIRMASCPKNLLSVLQTHWQITHGPLLKEEEWFHPDELLFQMKQAIQKPRFRALIQNRYKAVIVDEFQDTDPLQWDIFSSLFLNKSPSSASVSHTHESKNRQSIIPFAKNKCINLTRRQHKFLCLERATIANRQGASEDQKFVAKPTQSNMNLFFANGINSDLPQDCEKWGLDAFYLVGDPKQSIYRFRKADVYTYFRAREQLGKEALYCLNTNFRSSQSLIEALNVLFDRDWLPLPQLKSMIRSEKVLSGKQFYSPFQDEKKDIHCLFTENLSSYPFEECLLPYTIEEIEKLSKDHPSFSSYAILVKDRYQATSALELCQARGIPAIAKSHTPLAETLAFTAIKEFFKSLADPKDLSLQRIVRTGPFHFVSLKEANALLEKKQFVSLLRLLAQAGEEKDEMKKDLMQCIEGLLIWESNQGFSLKGLFRYFEEFEKLAPSEGNARRIEGTYDAVQILTLHVSKGLEFDVVFALGLATRTPNGEEVEEYNAEKLRQFYVGMTRAKLRLYLPIIFGEKTHSPATLSPIELFINILESQEGPIAPFLKKLSEKHSISFETLQNPYPISNPTLKESDYAIEKISNTQETYKTPIYNSSYLLSFTTLSKENSTPFVNNERYKTNEQYTPHTIPPGPETGILIHQIFERLFSQKRAVWKHLELIESLVGQTVRLSPLSQWKKAIVDMIWKTIHQPLIANDQTFSLFELERDQVTTEMEFLFESTPDFIKGFIDLVFFFRDRYYIVDWKTNWLGPNDQAYLNLDQCMTSHNYWLQGAIYSEALHRHVKQFYTKPFEELFGGVFYLFMRGAGVCYFRPEIDNGV